MIAFLNAAHTDDDDVVRAIDLRNYCALGFVLLIGVDPRAYCKVNCDCGYCAKNKKKCTVPLI